VESPAGLERRTMAKWPRLYHEIVAHLFERGLYWRRFATVVRIGRIRVFGGGRGTGVFQGRLAAQSIAGKTREELHLI
jgi:hypothetical protein